MKPSERIMSGIYSSRYARPLREQGFEFRDYDNELVGVWFGNQRLMLIEPDNCVTALHALTKGIQSVGPRILAALEKIEAESLVMRKLRKTRPEDWPEDAPCEPGQAAEILCELRGARRALNEIWYTVAG